jgi:NAD(P)-dependent dehydrogenase (short-subunit alcohol dehydrogenase family)
VTGAGGGLGLAIARRFAARGLSVHLTDVDGDAAVAAAEGIGGDAWGSALDVRESQACRHAAAKTVERAGSLDAWVNNAGILITGVAYEQELEVHRAMLEVNAIGTYNGTMAAIERMRETGRGNVINIISLAGLIAAPGVVGYSASKHAAIAFSLGTLGDLRRSGIKDIHISTVCPDGVWSPMLYDRLDDQHDAVSFSGKMLMPDEVATKVVRLLDRPKPVLAIPRWRGRFVRFFDRHPGLQVRLTPLVLRDALRRQKRFKRRVEAGKWPRGDEAHNAR